MNKVIKYGDDILQITKKEKEMMVQFRLSYQEIGDDGYKFDAGMLICSFPKAKVLKLAKELVEELEKGNVR